MKKKQFGFTLLEMLVVLGIIGVIMAIATSSFSTAQKKSRDAKRKSDLKTIQNAVEQYYSICGFKYPTPVASTVQIVFCPDPSVEILPSATLPKDPKTNNSYVYTGPADGSTYVLCVPTRVATPPVFESEAGSSTYCISNQQ